jgi:NADPH2:quinone reductase
VKAAVHYEPGPPEVLRYEDVPDPVCAPEGVVIEVRAVSVEGGDTLHRQNGPLPARPHIVGYQAAGVIREVGARVREREVGQRVVAIMPHGSHAERVAVPAGATWVIPDALDPMLAAAVPIPFGTAHDCLFEFGRLQADETVLIRAGAGAVGLACIQLAKRAGATVIATASSDAKLERLRDFGLDHGVNYRERDFVAAVRELTGGRGVDLAVDSVGGRTLAGSLEALRYRGRAITVGRAGRDPDPPDLSALAQGNRTLTGVFLGAEAVLNPGRVGPLIGRLLADVAKGELRVVLDRSFPLAEAAAAHRYIESRQAFGRVLLVP